MNYSHYKKVDIMKKLTYVLSMALFLSFSFVQGQELQEDDCTAGGPGSTSCSTTISGGGGAATISAEGSVTHTVSCGEGYYSCCNVTGANCVES